jgi:outer membrane protein
MYNIVKRALPHLLPVVSAVVLGVVATNLAAEGRTLLGAKVSLGLGVGAVPDYEGSDDYEGAPLLFYRMDWRENRYLEFAAGQFKANLLAHPSIEIGPIVKFRRNAWVDADDNRVKRLRGDGDAIEVGPFVGITLGKIDANLQLLKDVNAGHNGYVTTAEAGYTKTFANKRTQLRTSVETTYGSDDYMDGYFSIDTANAIRSRLDRYDADDDFRDVGLGLTLNHSLSPSWTVSGIFKYNRLLGDAEDSPVVDDQGDENQYFAGVMGIYHF